MTTESHNLRRALIVTGEASGDLHGANLILAARQIDPELAFFGVGGRRMAAAGCEILIPAEQLAVMGVVEVLGRFAVIRRAFRTLRRQLQGPRRPDLVILIDYPGFNLRLAKVAKAAGVPVLYYISPKVWAWKRGRIHTIAQRVDKLAVIFPFEPEIYRGLGLDVEYVGNPLLDESRGGGERTGYLQGHGLDPARPVIGLFPGSRTATARSNTCFPPWSPPPGSCTRRDPSCSFCCRWPPRCRSRTCAGVLRELSCRWYWWRTTSMIPPEPATPSSASPARSPCRSP
jgi:lipid-A-disaccharide synthase